MRTPVASFRHIWDQMPRNGRALLLCILALGVFLRLFCLDTFEFKGDELDVIKEGLAAAGQHWWIEHGNLSSVGIPNAPIFAYVMGLFTSITLDPFLLTAIFAALNCIALCLAVLFFAVFARNHRHFFLCVLFFSLSPYLILYSRKIWCPNLLLLFVIPLALMALWARERPLLLLPMGLISAFVFQLHQSGIFFVPLLTIIALFPCHYFFEESYESKLKKGKTVFWGSAGLIVFLLPLVPYLNFIWHNFTRLRYLYFTSHNSAPIPIDSSTALYGRVLGKVKAVAWLIRTSTGSHFWNYHLAGNKSDWNWPFPPLPEGVLILSYLLLIPLLLGLFYYAGSLGRCIRFRKTLDKTAALDRRDLMCIGSIAGMVLIYIAIGFQVHPHHFTIIFPFLILPLSLGTLSIFEMKGKWKNALRVFVAIGLVSYVLQYPFLLLYVKANNGHTGEYGVIYSEQRNAARKISTLTDKDAVTLNPLFVDLEGLPSPHNVQEIQDTIAYICHAVFEKQVIFRTVTAPGTRTLRLYNTGRKLEFSVYSD